MQLFRGTFIHCPRIGDVEVFQGGLVVDNSGHIIKVIDDLSQDPDLEITHVVATRANQFFLPGFIDTHIHAPQYRYAGTGTDLPLFDWLETYAFTTERALKDSQVARDTYTKLIKRLVSLGTTTANYFGTLHLEPTKVLVDVLCERGQRAIVGKVCMDTNCPSDYQQTVEENLQETRALLQYIKNKGNGLVTGAVVPRFIPSCTRELLAGLGDLVQQQTCPPVIHSHVSESLEEVRCSAGLHPEVKHEVDMFDQVHLLTSRTILAHGTQLCEDALKHLARGGGAVAHCPLSNFFFGDACFRVKYALHHGVKVGLGTDVAGGYTPSMLEAMRAAVVNSLAIRNMKLAGYQAGVGVLPPHGGPHVSEDVKCDPGAPSNCHLSTSGVPQHDVLVRPSDTPASMNGPLATSAGGASVWAHHDSEVVTFKDALWLATQGGAEALGLGDVVGTFAAGKEFDALLVDVTSPGNIDTFGNETFMQLMEKFLNLGDDRNICEVYVRGRCIRLSGP